jgi:hypothetical protein
MSSIRSISSVALGASLITITRANGTRQIINKSNDFIYLSPNRKELINY